MNKDNRKKMLLGLFTLIGLAILVVFIYLIGDKQDLFSKTYRLHAVFRNVNGLNGGHNVRYAGIDVGTVKDVRITSDSTVIVLMDVQEDVMQYVRKNAIARIGTDGLMGNKLVLIENVVDKGAGCVVEGDTLQTMAETDIGNLLATFARTNDNLERISGDILSLLADLKNEQGLFQSLVTDSTIVRDMRMAVSAVRQGGEEFAQLGRQMNGLVAGVGEGQGAAGAILKDTTLGRSLEDGLQSFENAGHYAVRITKNLDLMMRDIAAGKGSAGTILRDSGAALQVDSILANLRETSHRMNELLEAARHNFLFRRYFRRLQKRGPQ